MLGRTLALVAMLVCSLTWSRPAEAFSSAGHRVICQAALVLLQRDQSPEAQRARDAVGTLVMNLPARHKAAINGLLSRAATAPITFGDACVWADAVRDSEANAGLDGDHENTESWHYINVQRTARSVSIGDCLVGCLLAGFDVHARMVSEASGLNRTLALLYLAHWTGDIHQPLHVSFADDAGGNGLALSGVDCANMHMMWDRCIIDGQGMSNAQLVTELTDPSQLPAADELQRWRQDPPATWANESLGISLDPMTRYCRLQGGLCARMQLTNGRLPLTASYLTNNWPVVRLRMQKAAVRLASELKDLLGN